MEEKIIFFQTLLHRVQINFNVLNRKKKKKKKKKKTNSLKGH